MRREYNEQDRLRIIERYIKHNEAPRLVNEQFFNFSKKNFFFLFNRKVIIQQHGLHVFYVLLMLCMVIVLVQIENVCFQE
jgi:hypothetical protein